MRIGARILSLTALLLTVSIVSAERAPLLMEGKKSLYQRVLAIPGAALHFQPSDEQPGIPVTPFTAFYVYERRPTDGGEWLRIGADRFGDVVGWLRADRSLAWNQGLTVSFRDPIDQDRALLFRDQATLRELVQDHDMAGYETLYRDAEAGKLPEDSPVVAMQPPGFIDIREDFYLVPILEHEDVYLGSEQARMLKVSSVPLNELPAASPAAGEPAAAESGSAEPAGRLDTPDLTAGVEPAAAKPASAARNSRGYTAGLVFVIDSTLSMDPYIDRTREAVIKIYDSLADADLLGHVNFGLVAYRDSLRAAPGLEYLAKTFVTLEQGRDPGSFLKRVKSLRASKVSSRHFREDSYSGVRQAIEDIDWQGTDARYVVLITDAGAREPKDPLAGTGLSAQNLHHLAQDKGIANFVLHLLTPSRFADHDIAEKQYRALSQYPGIGDLYYGVKTGKVEEFGQVLDALAGQITGQVQAAVTASAAPVAVPIQATGEPGPQPTRTADPINPQLAALQEKVAKLGYALRLRYLSRKDNGGAPTVFEAWVLDRDFRNPERRMLDIRVLLTRDQLSDLHDILKQVLEQAEEGLLSPQGFLDELKSLAATIARDPERLGATTATTAGTGNSLTDLGFMREYIEDLPYAGEVMSLSLDDWQSWPAQRQIAFLNSLEEKISYYRALHDHTDLWVSLDGGPIDGDSVYPIALEQLP